MSKLFAQNSRDDYGIALGHRGKSSSVQHIVLKSADVLYTATVCML